MRLDKYLSSVNILKRRAIAQDMCENNAISLNGKLAKSSKIVKVGDVITLHYLQYQKHYEILALPTSKTVPKSQSHIYVKAITT